jgi:hypothetical protein
MSPFAGYPLKSVSGLSFNNHPSSHTSAHDDPENKVASPSGTEPRFGKSEAVGIICEDNRDTESSTQIALYRHPV